ASSPHIQQGGVVAADAIDEDAKLFGGAAALLIDAPSYVVMAALERPEAYFHVLPRVLAVEQRHSNDDDQSFRLTHGKGLIRASYVLRVRHEWNDTGTHVIRFWVDTRYPRDVKDAWGYFEMRPMGAEQTLLTYQVRVALLPGVVRMLFAERIQRGLMSVPERARQYVYRCRDQSAALTPTAGEVGHVLQ
ncbi:MAG: hypothetical protein MUF54_14330, partial [Polyangiaceae bacterium]|nr:hypothetical protein [Polyangiaceae bacterium]